MAAPRRVKAVIIDLKRYRDNITLYRLRPDIRLKFRPGQFMHIALDTYDPSYNWPESRVFSMASAPGEEYIDILVSPKGSFTKRMIKELTVGREVWIKLPYGTFDFNASDGKDIVLIAGGTGISPFISFLQEIYEKDADSRYHSISLFYGVRTPDLVIYEEQLERFHKKIENYSYRIYCENIDTRQSDTLHQGPLPVDEIINEVTFLKDTVYYLSGPGTMINAFEKMLRERAISQDRICFDTWE